MFCVVYQPVKKLAPSAADSALEVGPLKPADSGVYTCLVNNSVGTDSVQYSLQVVCEWGVRGRGPLTGDSGNKRSLLVGL